MIKWEFTFGNMVQYIRVAMRNNIYIEYSESAYSPNNEESTKKLNWKEHRSVGHCLISRFLSIALVYLLRNSQVHFENVTRWLFNFFFLAIFVKWKSSWFIICGALDDLIPFVQFKKREKKNPWRSVNFSKVFHVF